MYKALDFAYDMQKFNEIINIDPTYLTAIVFLSENLQFTERLNDALNMCVVTEDIINFKNIIEPLIIAAKLKSEE